MQTLCIFLSLMCLNKKENAMRRKKCTAKTLLCEKVERACLSVIEFEEESRFGNRQLGLKNCGNCSTQLFVHIRIKATNGHQLTIGCWLLSPTKCNGYRSFQHNHHILHKNRYKMVKAFGEEIPDSITLTGPLYMKNQSSNPPSPLL
jgi:hypothetical protein